MRDWLTNDLAWKLFSVLLALAIWVTVHKHGGAFDSSGVDMEKTTYSDLPVTIVSTNANAQSARVTPNSVIVTVSGPADIMDSLQANRIHAVVNLTDASGRNLRRHVDVSVPPGVTLLDVIPADVTVTILPPEKKP